MNKPTIYFRADGNSTIGLGHIFRLLAIVEMVESVLNCVFIGRDVATNVIPLIQNKCTYIQLPSFETYDLEALFLVKTYQHQVFVLDGYSFKTTYQNHLKSTSNKLVYLDDLQAFHISADVILNHAGNVDHKAYSSPAYTQFYTGLAYAILRLPFLKAAQKPPRNHLIETAFVCFGGTDIHNYTLQALEKLVKYPSIQAINVVIGQANLHRSILEKWVQNYPHIQLLSNLNAEEMVEVMSKSSIAICSSSTICYEYACVKGLLFVIQTADNQENLYQYCINSGLAHPFEAFDLSYDRLKIMTQQSQIIDGKSQERILTLLKTLVL